MKIDFKMATRRKNIRKYTPKVEQKLETTEVNGEVFYPCKICEGLLKTPLEAVLHFQDCKPDDSEENVRKESNGNLKSINNNYIENNALKQRRRVTRSAGITVEKGVSEESIETCNNNESVPKNKSISNIGNNNNSKVILHNSVNSQTNPNRRGKKLTEEQIAERLRLISEKLRIKKEVKAPCEDDEEEERREIEDKLTALNKDSESTYHDEYQEFEDLLQEQEDRANLKSKNSLVKKLIKNSRGLSDELLNPEVFNGLNCLNPPPISKEPIIITQSPDGELRDCPSCSEVFYSELELLRHKREKHTYPKITMAPEEVKKYYDIPDRSSCPICKRFLTIKTKSMFIKHLQIHTYVGEHECSICKRKFKRLDHMKTHKKRHITTTYI